MELLNQFFKRQILMFVRAQSHFADPRQEFVKSGIACQVGAKEQSIDKEPNQAFGFEPVASGDRRAYDEIVLAGIAIEQGFESRQQHHKKAALPAVGQSPK